MKISIIIPTLNEAPHLEKLLHYLLAHGNGLIQEIIVVDGGSTDSTTDLANKCGASVFISPVPSRAKQMNLGAANATAEVLYFIHADTLPPVTFAEDILSEMEAGYAMGCYRYQFDSTHSLLKLNAWFVRFQWLVCQGGR